MTTPSTLNELTLSAPLMIGEATGKTCLTRLLKAIVSLVLEGFSLRLCRRAFVRAIPPRLYYFASYRTYTELSTARNSLCWHFSTLVRHSTLYTITYYCNHS